MPSTRLPVLGLLGGVASGKSFVANVLARHGGLVLDADRAGHETLTEPAVKHAIEQRFGSQVFDEHGDVIRKALGAIVFSDPAALRFLEELTHPRIGQRLLRQLEQGGNAVAAVLDAPVMLKAGWDGFCSEIWFVDAPREVRLQRALERGWTAAQFAAREAAQESLEEKRRRSDRVISNFGTSDSVEKTALSFWNEFIGRSRSESNSE